MVKKGKCFFGITFCLSYVSLFLLVRTIASGLIAYYSYKKYYLGYGVIACIVAAVHLAVLVFCTVRSASDVKRNNSVSRSTAVILFAAVLSLAFWIVAVKYNEMFVYIGDVDELIRGVSTAGQSELLRISKSFAALYYAFDVALAGIDVVFAALSLSFVLREKKTTNVAQHEKTET